MRPTGKATWAVAVRSPRKPHLLNSTLGPAVAGVYRDGVAGLYPPASAPMHTRCGIVSLAAMEETMKMATE